MKILIVEDDAAMGRALCYHLEQEGYETEWRTDGEQAYDSLAGSPFALVILDRMLPGLSGMDLLRRIRRERLDTRVLMLTALGSVEARVEGLDAGADDYLAKPFEVSELLARVRSLCRRSPLLGQDYPEAGGLRLNLPLRLLEGPSGSSAVSKREAQLLEIFLCNPGQTLPRSLLFTRVWGPHAPVEEGNLDSYIHFLRRRIRQVGGVCRLKTVHGIGYRLEIRGEGPC
ncbi:MAG: response regulator transcription factor [Provencibacterium sp.]|jgi:two-component system OmpR family response regulator|nr:response regulator transcription factor [Provencibacterium sp.]